MKSLLEFRHLRFGWRRQPRPLFSSLDLEVPSKTATVLLGPNGAGKTTIMDLALGWRLPQEGEIFLGGKPIGRWGNRERGRFMALVPQDEAILFDYSVMEYILLGRAPHLPPLGIPGEEDRRIAAAALKETGIGHLADRRSSRLSGGERQLILLARALTQEPRLLLLDEPISHLDLYNREKILGILNKLLKRGISLFFTSHDLELALRLAGHAILLKDGEILQAGPSGEILNEANLTKLYNIPVRIGQVDGRKAVAWGASEA